MKKIDKKELIYFVTCVFASLKTITMDVVHSRVVGKQVGKK